MTSIREFQGTSPLLNRSVYVDPTATVIGKVTLGDDTSVWPMAIIRGDVNEIRIGKACNIQDAAILHVTHDGPFSVGGRPLILGQGVTIGHQAVLHGCTVEDYCLIGMGALILDAVHIESQVMVAAGSVVPPGKILKSGHLYLGNPARALRTLSSKELDHLKYSAEYYVSLKNKYLSQKSNNSDR